MDSFYDYELRHYFVRPSYLAPKHPIFSSPFVKRISLKAFGSKKPKWYKRLNSTQLSLFKNLINYVEEGRQGFFRFSKFLKTLQELDSSIKVSEILDIIENDELDDFEELDLGKLLFSLAYNDPAADVGNEEETVSAKRVTRRQSLILSAIANYVLIASVGDIERYYTENSRRKSTVLHYHLIATKLKGLTEVQMEDKQLKTVKILRPLDWYTYGELMYSPYAEPVPFVPSFVKGKVYKEWKKSKYSLPIITLEKSVSKPLIPPDVKRELGEDVVHASKSEKIVSKMNYGRIPIPVVQLEEKKIRQMREGFTVELKDYAMKKAFEAKKKFRTRLKQAATLYVKKNIISVLRQGFPTDKDRDTFINVYQRYLPFK